MRISVLGVMGTGKSTLAYSLANELRLPFVPEPYEANPWLPLCYEDGAKYGLLTQLAFIPLFLAHSQRWGVLDGSLLLSSLVYAPVYLEGEDGDYLRYCQVVHSAMAVYQKPDLYICLKADPEVILERIRKRSRGMETAVSLEFIEKLSLYTSELYAKIQTPKLVLDWNEFRPIKEVAAQVRGMV